MKERSKCTERRRELSNWGDTDARTAFGAVDDAHGLMGNQRSMDILLTMTVPLRDMYVDAVMGRDSGLLLPDMRR
jgi:hypothetical protein